MLRRRCQRLDEAVTAILVQQQRLRMFTAVPVREAEEAGQLSPVQLRALTVFTGLGGANLGALALGRGIAVSTASRLVDRPVAAGWVSRRMSAATRREVTLELTGEGVATLARYDRCRLAALRDILADVPAGRRGDVVQSLDDLVACGGERTRQWLPRPEAG